MTGQERSRAAWRRYLAKAPTRAEALRRCVQLLEDTPPCLATMDVHELLESCRGVGPQVADRWQTALEMFAAIPLRELGTWRRAALIALLKRRARERERRST